MSQNSDNIDIFDVSGRVGINLYSLLKALNSLAESGLVDAARLRLTLGGLAMASALNGALEPSKADETDEDADEDEFEQSKAA
jgi:hypothetical protein